MENYKEIMDYMQRKVARTLTGIGGLLGIVLLVGSGISRIIKKPMEEPKIENYREFDGRDLSNHLLTDIDGDGDVDIIHGNPAYGADNNHNVYAIAPEMVEVSKKIGFIVDYFGDNTTLRMTPDMQVTATDIMKKQKDLAYKLDKLKYDRSKVDNKH